MKTSAHTNKQPRITIHNMNPLQGLHFDTKDSWAMGSTLGLDMDIDVDIDMDIDIDTDTDTQPSRSMSFGSLPVSAFNGPPGASPARRRLRSRTSRPPRRRWRSSRRTW